MSTSNRTAYIDESGATWCLRCAAARWGEETLRRTPLTSLGLGVHTESTGGELSCEQCGRACTAEVRVPAEVTFMFDEETGAVKAGIIGPCAGGLWPQFLVRPDGLVAFTRGEAVSSVQRRFLADCLRWRGGDRAFRVVAGPPYALGAKYTYKVTKHTLEVA